MKSMFCKECGQEFEPSSCHCSGCCACFNGNKCTQEHCQDCIKKSGDDVVKYPEFKNY